MEIYLWTKLFINRDVGGLLERLRHSSLVFNRDSGFLQLQSEVHSWSAINLRKMNECHFFALFLASQSSKSGIMGYKNELRIYQTGMVRIWKFSWVRMPKRNINHSWNCISSSCHLVDALWIVDRSHLLRIRIILRSVRRNMGIHNQESLATKVLQKWCSFHWNKTDGRQFEMEI